VFANPDDLTQFLADRVCEVAAQCRQDGRPCVLGLCAGATPLRTYQELRRRHEEDDASFEHCVVFGVDDYYPMPAGDPRSFRSYLAGVASRLGIDAERVHSLRGDVRRAEASEYCAQYERMIEESGGITLQLLGIGRSGHVGFNEPGSLPQQRTRLVSLHDLTRQDAAVSFGGLESVPREAITIGLATILDAREVILMADGVRKAAIVKDLVEGSPTPDLPASFLRLHDTASLCIDADAGSMLSIQHGEPGTS
jgi:glucosamine-6-phosphate deaminase